MKEVLLADDFNIGDLEKFSAAREMQRLDNYTEGSAEDTFKIEDGWQQSTVKIKLPAEDNKTDPRGEAGAPEFEVPGLFHRPLLDTIKAGLREESSNLLHHTPFRSYWKPSEDVPPERLYGEQYTSDALLEEHEKIQALPREPGDNMERVTLPIMLWSDSTHLADFGNASLWPIYMFFGGLSKYIRAKPTSGACHHIAYIPSVSLLRINSSFAGSNTKKLPDYFQDNYKEFFGRSTTAAMLTHCKRELMHAILAMVIDERFIEAYENGFEFLCHDGIIRRFFPRILTYSADYPEK